MVKVARRILERFGWKLTIENRPRSLHTKELDSEGDGLDKRHFL